MQQLLKLLNLNQPFPLEQLKMNSLAAQGLGLCAPLRGA